MRKTARGNVLVCLALLGVIAVGQLLLTPRRQPLVAGHCHGAPRWFHGRNAPAYLEYGRRMRTGFSFQVRARCGQNADLIKKFKADEYRGHRDEFESDIREFCNALEESSALFDGQEVPPVLFKSHAKISNCYRLCYQSVQALREAYEAEGAEQSRLVKMAEAKMKQAWVTGEAGVKLHKEIWDLLATDAHS